VKNEEFYGQAYQNPEFVRVYQETRNALYQHIAGIIRALGDTYALDVGCSLGLLVEHLHREGISSWGVDFDLPQLRQVSSSRRCFTPCYQDILYSLGSGLSDPLQWIAEP